jgi:hypothetical protein
LLANEALDVLGLKRGASAVEIKEAYRDMVKVWHPDRFGSDARLRRKAEDKLKEINDAYRVLQSGSTTAEETAKDAGSDRGNLSSTAGRRHAPIHRGHRTGSKRSTSVGWMKVCVSVALLLPAGYWLLEREPMHAARPSPASAQQGGDAGSQSTPKDPVEPLQPQDSVRSNHSSSAQFQVRPLSEAETEQLETACSRQKESHDQAAYRACVKAQVDLIKGTLVEPDLSRLSAVERESLESACSKVTGYHGANAYNRCVATQMADLAAEPERPDMSTLSAADRDSIEQACRGAKYRDGPSAYNRCRGGIIKLLADSK